MLAAVWGSPSLYGRRRAVSSLRSGDPQTHDLACLNANSDERSAAGERDAPYRRGEADEVVRAAISGVPGRSLGSAEW